MNNNPSFRKFLVFTMIAVLLFPSTILLAEMSGAELLSLLREKDHVFNSTGYKFSFVMSMNGDPFDPNQGRVFMDCKATWTTEGSFAMKITNYYEHPPVFALLGSGNYGPIDYDEDGNLIIWRSLEKYILSEPDRNDSIEKIKSFFVAPNSNLVDKGGTQTLLHRFPIGSRDNMYQFNQFQLAIGQGFSRHLGTVTSIKILSSGLMKVTSQGSHGSVLGTWEVTLDPNFEYLVRKGNFTHDRADKPTIVIASNGIIMKDKLKVAKYGTLRFSDLFELSVEVTDISKVVGPNKLYDEVLSRLNSPLPPGSDITDFRGKKPIITTGK